MQVDHLHLFHPFPDFISPNDGKYFPLLLPYNFPIEDSMPSFRGNVLNEGRCRSGKNLPFFAPFAAAPSRSRRPFGRRKIGLLPPPKTEEWGGLRDQVRPFV
jgi:hypothetical protein